MDVSLRCPRCSGTELDLCSYESMIVLSVTHALFTMNCPNCGARVSAVRPIPVQLQEEVRYAAIEVGAGMGRVN